MVANFWLMAGDFSTEVNATDEATVIHVRGEIDMATAGRLRDVIEPHMGPKQTIVLDLSTSWTLRPCTCMSKRVVDSPITAAH